MPLIYVYDDSFDGLLTALYESYYAPVKPDSINAESEFKEDLFTEKVDVAVDFNKSASAVNIVTNLISFNAMHNIFYAFLAGCPDHGGVIYDYFKFGISKGRLTDKYLHEPRVIAVHKLRDRLHAEKHRLIGLLRFEKIDLENGRCAYYAECCPDNNVIGLMAPHFSARLPNERWMIHDVKRGIAVLNYKMLENIDEKVEKDERYVLKNEYERDIKIASDNNINWLITAFSINEPPRRGCGEELYSRLWREFVKNIAVENRTNHKLQKCCMPARYWKYLTEMKPYDKLK